MHGRKEECIYLFLIRLWHKNRSIEDAYLNLFKSLQPEKNQFLIFLQLPIYLYLPLLSQNCLNTSISYLLIPFLIFPNLFFAFINSPKQLPLRFTITFKLLKWTFQSPHTMWAISSTGLIDHSFLFWSTLLILSCSSSYISDYFPMYFECILNMLLDVDIYQFSILGYLFSLLGLHLDRTISRSL